MHADKVRLSISQHFHNKDNRATMRPNQEGRMSNLWAFAAFDNVLWTAQEIAAHITAGKAICIATHSKRRKEEFFSSSQLMGVDFDHGPDVSGLLLDPF